MKNKFIKYSLLLFVIAAVSSCAKKLDLFPQNDLTPEKAYSTAAGYKSVLAKIYGTMATSGNAGPAGAPDISGNLDEGSQIPFIRMFFNCQELPTDEAVVAWNDQTIKDFHNLTWSAGDPFLKGLYARPVYNVTLINEYLRECTDAKLADRGITGVEADNIKKSVAEVRFLRAFNYWVMMDIFGKSTFVTEADAIGATLPREINRADLFAYIESELLAIDADLAPVKTIEYGRVDQGAAWALLARMYLNAEVYIGAPKYTEAVTYAAKVIGGGYSLYSSYPGLFMADNDKATNEFIYAINCDGVKTTGYGNTTFFVHCAAGDDASEYGVSGGWYGYRATSALVTKFADRTGSTDRRALFTTSRFGTSDDQLRIDDIGDFNDGPHVKKYVNLRSDGLPTTDASGTFADVDFPVFRLAEMYLIYAEAVLRGGSGGSRTTALGYINQLRQRAYGTTSSGQVNDTELSLDFILDERARELYWEGHRRTDLIRYGLLTTGTYLWPWKGGVASGTAKSDIYNLFAIPASNIVANPNLTQNPGY
ncbi:MAG TPA: RagB/SusD family nutrient uptake outer membrane protein [Ferruginibacter sp.]|nr:RagB/SusD family nutrient uptake outer membrane protein [Ferruginibacter sp.]HPH90328.1 RagB/SusD family nutrient uptake outer membrane protein [Ferruginibacter sp.]